MPTFKKPSSLESFIQIWGWMDDIVKNTKKGKALTYWKKNGTPYGVSYSNLICNRYWFKEEFRREIKTEYRRIYDVFLDTMSI
jgi:hypothetical protein